MINGGGFKNILAFTINACSLCHRVQICLPNSIMIKFILVQNRQGKTRLSKWCITLSQEERQKLSMDVHKIVAIRDAKNQSNFAEFRNYKIVYRRYAGLYFCFVTDPADNELATLEA